MSSTADATTSVALVERFPALRPPISTAGAAVTIVLRDGARDVEVLLIRRANDPQDPASGDVALPGGRVDDRDSSLAATALRELREEVGLGLSDLDGPLRFVGATPARRFGLTVGVFAAVLGSSATSPRIGDPAEVAHVFWLPRPTLVEGRPITLDLDRGPLRVTASVHDGHVVWGFTRRVLRDFFGLPTEDPPIGAAFPDVVGADEPPPAPPTSPGDT